MDETGILEGKGFNGLVLGMAETNAVRKKEPGSRSWMSIIECISAGGTAIKPLLIYKGKSVQQQWFPLELKELDGWEFTATDNGWTTDQTALTWKASDLCGQLKLSTELSPDHNTQRLLFRKVKKAFSEKSYLLASSRQQVRVLEARVKRIAPRKKKSVQTDPNTKFANIRDIKRAQEDAGERLLSPSRIVEVELPSEGSGRIVVAVEGD
ncbi:transposase [Colletotrichum tamarilloi]|uniref:Transposase n=1 Tax=Colletotrichum tamarilloi TaxID=1209934 RepID=A0ABQ9QH64_9PEZI|nr:transposase [Colletotrichum tamarilloi]KAK1470099.1 transposase [Colletotrichum tamarilloi]